MPKFEKGSKEAKAWGLKMKKAKEMKNKMKGGYLQPEEMPESMKPYDSNNLVDTKEGIIDGSGLSDIKKKIDEFRRKWSK